MSRITLCTPRPDMDADFVFLELLIHIGSAILLGLAVDVPWTVFRRRVLDRAVERGDWANVPTRKALLYLSVFFAHFATILGIFWFLSKTIPCIIQEWQYSLEGMFFPAIFFTLQTNLFTCLTGGFYDFLG